MLLGATKRITGGQWRGCKFSGLICIKRGLFPRNDAGKEGPTRQQLQKVGATFLPSVTKSLILIVTLSRAACWACKDSCRVEVDQLHRKVFSRCGNGPYEKTGNIFLYACCGGLFVRPRSAGGRLCTKRTGQRIGFQR